MKRTLCYSVRLESLVRISPKAFKATAFDGSSDIIPASQVFGRDDEVQKSEAWWIAAWILEKKHLQFSDKKKRYFDENRKTQKDGTSVSFHIPERINAVNNNEINELKK